MDEDNTQDGFEVSDSRSSTMSPRPDDPTTQDLDSVGTLREASEDPHKASDQDEETATDDVDTQQAQTSIRGLEDARSQRDSAARIGSRQPQRFRLSMLDSGSSSSAQEFGNSTWAEDSGVYMGYDYPNLRVRAYSGGYPTLYALEDGANMNSSAYQPLHRHS